MKTINLRDYYPCYGSDLFLEVDDEIAEVLIWFSHQEQNQRARIRYNLAFYSLDCNDGVENGAVHRPLTPAEIHEIAETDEYLMNALAHLPRKQADRLTRHYILAMSQVDIAEVDGVSPAAISLSIKTGLDALKKILESF